VQAKVAGDELTAPGDEPPPPMPDVAEGESAAGFAPATGGA